MDGSKKVTANTSYLMYYDTCKAKQNNIYLTQTFQGPYKQFKGRSKNTGNITIVLYEDPPDRVPKIHVRSSKYMAWIAENNLPVHLHTSKVLHFSDVTCQF